MPLTLTLTQDGLSAIVDAENGGTAAITIAEVGLTAEAFIASPTLTELPGEFGRLDSVSGEAVDDSTVHIVTRDGSAGTYTVRGFGLYLADGTLFATYAQAEPIFEKAAVATFLLATDIKLLPGQAELIQFGNANFLNPPATRIRAGVARLATPAEAAAGTDDESIITPAQLAPLLAQFIPLAQRAVANGVATLGGDGKVSPSQLPAFDAIDVFVVADQAAMLGLAASVADFAIRTDISKTYILTALPATTLANWVEFLSPGAPVLSVNNKTGAVTLTPADLGAVPTTRNITGGGLVTGGGNLAADRQLQVLKASAAEALAGQFDDRAVTPAALSSVLNEIVARAYRHITITGSGLATGGGDLTNHRAINVNKASGWDTENGWGDDRAVTPVSLASFSRQMSQNGYHRIPGGGGLIIQWGRFTAQANGRTTVNLPITFPNAFFAVVANGTSDNNTNAQDNWPAPVMPPPNNGQFQVQSANNSPDSCYFIALGM
ncbi:hypothetical protein FHS96_003084 [Sphingomonas zeicaulis]|uniref:gp53-like domain-containing protein n=1 Tax=Sphingomonas zeicaulis TaxID=1632740 RepID=UPI003D1FF53D